MFRGIFLFEIEYRKSRPATYVYAIIIFFTCFLIIASPIQRAIGQTYPNAPYLIGLWTLIMSFIFTMITSAVMGVSIVRDFDHHTEGILFSYPIKKIDYLMGRFCGSFFVLVLINSAVVLGLMAGIVLGQYVPWEVAWRNKELLPFNLWHYLHPFLVLTVCNLFATGAIFFMVGALARNTIVIYTQGIILILLFNIGNTFLADQGPSALAALIDPFGVQAVVYYTRYWTSAEQNVKLIAFDGLILYNRLLWLGIGVASLAVTYYVFSFRTVRNLITDKIIKQIREEAPEQRPTDGIGRYSGKTGIYPVAQCLRLSIFYFKMIWKEIPFLAIVATGLLVLFINALKMNTMYGTSSYPTTYAVLNLMNSFSFFLLIIAILYTGELIWKDRSVNVNLIVDALPVSGFTSLAAKFIGMVLVYASLLLLLILGGVLVQAAYGHFRFDLPVYFGTLYTSTLSFLVVFTLFTIFIQVLVNNKFLGFAICVLFFLLQTVLSQLGIEHGLLRFASGTLGTFSDMNAYGHFVTPFAWFKIYWTAFSALLFSIAVVFAIRGHDAAVKMRLRSGKTRITRPLIIFSTSALGVFLFCGIYIYYNTSVISRFEGKNTLLERQSAYEKALVKNELLEHPKIVEASMTLEIFPATRNFNATGFYYLKNKSRKPIQEIHIQHNVREHLRVDYVKFDREAPLEKAFGEFGYFIYQLSQPLEPGDSLRMDFKESYRTKGFQETSSNTDIVFNGTFLSSNYFPSIGYNKNFELTDDDVRSQNHLPPKRSLRANDSKARETSLFGDDADRIRFDMIVGTEKDQIAVAPGRLKRTWEKNGRRYFHYVMDTPIANFYSVVSARYAVKREKWNGVDLEVYYHPGHEYNLDRMFESMKSSLAYHERNFSPYQYRQLRILEFPRYNAYAQSFPNSIPFSEGIGFILKVDDPEKDLDVAYYVTAHEVAHQWWGHQVMQADTKGSGMLSESLSQYSSLMVLKHEFPTEVIERYLRYELDAYLSGRATERGNEEPLRYAERQNYIHYNKASLVFYALQDYIGEENLNRALRAYVKEWAFKDPPYPTSDDLLGFIRKETPDSLRYLIHDLFETITLFENKTTHALYEEIPGGKFEMTIKTSTTKMRADSLGIERRIPMEDWIDIGIYATDELGKDKLIYLQKHKIVKEENTFVIQIGQKPSRAGIDPLHKLIDRHSNDNTMKAEQVVDIGNALGF
jgi:ABC-2 type transport system permease protein